MHLPASDPPPTSGEAPTPTVTPSPCEPCHAWGLADALSSADVMCSASCVNARAAPTPGAVSTPSPVPTSYTVPRPSANAGAYDDTGCTAGETSAHTLPCQTFPGQPPPPLGGPASVARRRRPPRRTFPHRTHPPRGRKFSDVSFAVALVRSSDTWLSHNEAFGSSVVACAPRSPASKRTETVPMSAVALPPTPKWLWRALGSVVMNDSS